MSLNLRSNLDHSANNQVVRGTTATNSNNTSRNQTPTSPMSPQSQQQQNGGVLVTTPTSPMTPNAARRRQSPPATSTTFQVARRPQESSLYLSPSQQVALRLDSSVASNNVTTTSVDPYTASAKQHAYSRPSSYTSMSKQYLRKFVVPSGVAPRPQRQTFTGTKQICEYQAPDHVTDARCAEVVGQTVWIANRDGSISIYDRDHGSELDRTVQHETICTAIQQVGEEYVWCGFSDGFIRVFDRSNANHVLVTFSRHSGTIHALAYQEGGNSVYSAGVDFTINHYRASDFSFVRKYVGHSACVRSLVCHHDVLFSGADDGVICIWNTLESTEPGSVYSSPLVKTWQAHGKSAGVKTMAYTEGFLWTGGSDEGMINIWDVQKILNETSFDASGSPARGDQSNNNNNNNITSPTSPNNNNNNPRQLSLVQAAQTLATAAKSAPVESIRVVATTIWIVSGGILRIYDSRTRQVLQESRFEGYLTSMIVVAENLMSRVWLVGANGTISAWNSESVLRGDDNYFQEEERRRGIQVVQLGRELEEANSKIKTIEVAADERQKRHRAELQHQQQIAEARACTIVQLEQKIDTLQTELQEKEVSLSDKNKNVKPLPAEAQKSVNKVLSAHIQSTEKKLLEAEATIQRLQGELQRASANTSSAVGKLDSTKGRKPGGDSSSAANNNRDASAEMLISEQRDQIDEQTSRISDLEGKLNSKEAESVDATTKLEVARRKLTELQRIVSQMSEQDGKSGGGRFDSARSSQLESIQKTIRDAMNKTGTSAALSKEAASKAKEDKAAEAKKPRKMGPIPLLGAKPTADKMLSYIKTLCAPHKSADTLPEPQQEALIYDNLRSRDRSLDSACYGDVVASGQQSIGPTLNQLQLPEAFGSLNQTQQHSMILTACRAYNEQFMQLSRFDHEQWFSKNVIFPSLVNVMKDIHREVENFRTLPQSRKSQIVEAVVRGNIIDGDQGAYRAPVYLVNNAARNDQQTIAQAGQALMHNGPKILTVSQRRQLLLQAISPFFPDWNDKSSETQLSYVLLPPSAEAPVGGFTVPSWSAVEAEVQSNWISNGNVPQSSILLLAALHSAANFSASIEELYVIGRRVLADPSQTQGTNPKVPNFRQMLSTNGTVAFTTQLNETQRNAVLLDFYVPFMPHLLRSSVADGLRQLNATANEHAHLESQIDDANKSADAAGDADEDADEKRKQEGYAPLSTSWPPAHLPRLVARDEIPEVWPIYQQLSAMQPWPPIYESDEHFFARAVVASKSVQNETLHDAQQRLLGSSNFKTLSAKEQVFILAHVLLDSIGVSAQRKEALEWMRDNCKFPNFADVEPILKACVERGVQNMPLDMVDYLIGSSTQGGNLMMDEQIEVSRLFTAQALGNANQSIQTAFAMGGPNWWYALSMDLKQHIFRAFLGRLVPFWGKYTESNQLLFINSRDLMSMTPTPPSQSRIPVLDATSFNRGNETISIADVASRLKLPLAKVVKLNVIRHGDRLKNVPRKGRIILPDPDHEDTVLNYASRFDAIDVNALKMENPHLKADSARIPPGTKVFTRLDTLFGTRCLLPNLPANRNLGVIAQEVNLSVTSLFEANASAGWLKTLTSAATTIIPATACLVLPLPPGVKKCTLRDVEKHCKIPAYMLLEENPHIASADTELISGTTVLFLPEDVLLNGSPKIKEPMTLAALARQTGIPLAELTKANPGLTATQPIEAGTSVTLPPRSAKSGGKARTVTEIAAQMGVSVPEFLATNHQYKSGNDIVDPSSSLKVVSSTSADGASGSRPLSRQQTATNREPITITIEQPKNNNQDGAASGGVNLANIAKQRGLTIQCLLAANPSIKSAYSPIAPGTNVKVPYAEGDNAADWSAGSPENTAAIKQRIAFQTQPGVGAPQNQTLASIAAKYGISLQELQEANPNIRIDPRQPIAGGERIVIPARKSGPAQSVEQLASRQGMTIDEFIALNPNYNDRSERVPANQQIIITSSGLSQDELEDQRALAQSRQPQVTTVSVIAQQHGVSEDELLAANPQLAGNSHAAIQPGTRITLPARNPSDPPRTVQQCADAARIPVQEFIRLNPQFKSANETVPAQTRIVIETSASGSGGHQQQQQQGGQVEKPTIAILAKQHGVSEQAMLQANPEINSVDQIIPTGTRIVVPGRGSSGETRTVQQVAQDEGMTIEQFLKANPQYHSASDRVNPTQPIAIITSREMSPIQRQYYQQHQPELLIQHQQQQQPQYQQRSIEYQQSYGSQQQQQQPQYQYQQQQIQYDSTPQLQTLSSLAQQYGVTEAEMLQANPTISSGSTPIPPGQQIVIPASKSSSSYSSAAPQMTVREVAQQQGMTVQEFIGQNPQYTSADQRVQPNRSMVINSAPAVAPPPPQQSQYAQGQQFGGGWSQQQQQYQQQQPQFIQQEQPQTIRMISQQTGIPEQILLQANPSIQSADQPIQQGQRIVMPPRQQQSGQPPQTVRQMAQQYNMPVQDFIQANPQFKSADDVVQPQQQINYVSRPQVQYVQQQPGQAPPPPRQQTLAQIAQQNGIPEHVLVQANPSVGGAHAPIQPGTRIVMPPRQQQPGQPPQTVQQFAASNGMQVQEFMQANPQFRSANDTIQPNQQVTYVASAQPQQFVQQQQPQTIRQISQQTGVPEQVLLQANPSIQSADQPIQQGQRIVVPPRQQQPGQPPQTVRQMAQQYNMPVQDFIQANPQFKSADDVVQPQQQINMVAQPQMQYVPASPQQQQQYQQQQPGFAQQGPPQTIRQISQQTGVPEQVLLRANPSVQSVDQPIPPGVRFVVPPRQGGQPQTVQQLAAANNVSVQEFVQANPQFKGAGDTVQPHQQFTLPPPRPQQQQQPQFIQQQQPQQLRTLTQIAAANNIPVQELVQANPSLGGAHVPIQPGTRVVMPGRRTGPPQTVSEIAAANNISTQEFIAANPEYTSGTDVIQPARQITIPAARPQMQMQMQPQQQFGVAPSSWSQQQQQPQAPRTLAEIAFANNIPEQELVRANPQIGGANAPIQPGTRIVMPPRQQQPGQPPQSVQQFAAANNVPVQQVLQANPQFRSANDTIQPGQQLNFVVPQQQQQSFGGVPAWAQQQQQPQTIRQISLQTGVPEQVLLRANPSLQSVDQPIPPGVRFVVPPRQGGQPQTVQQLAAANNVPVQEFIQANPQFTSANDMVRPDQQFTLPPPRPQQQQYQQYQQQQPQFIQQEQPQTIRMISQQTGVPEQILLQANPSIQSADQPIQQGQRIVMPPRQQQPGQPPQTVRQMAQQYNMPVQEFIQANPQFKSADDVVQPQQQINYVSRPQVQYVQQQPGQAPPPPRQQTLAQIAQQNGIPEHVLVQANPSVGGAHAPIQPGTRIVMPPRQQQPGQPPQTVQQFAASNGMQVQEFMQANPQFRSANDTIQPNQQVTYVASAQPQQFVQQQQPQTIRQISQQTGIPEQILLQANPSIQSADQPIQQGQRIVVPPRQQQPGQPPQTVRQMAQQYNMPVQDFIQANPQFKSADDVVQPQQQINMVAQPQMQYVPASPQQQQQYQQQQPGFAQQGPPPQTIRQISQQTGVPEQVLLRANPSLQSVDQPIPPGVRFVVPPRQGGQPQTVQQLAAANNVPVQEFIQANPQFTSANDMVRPDQQFTLPPPRPQQQQYQQYQQQQPQFIQQEQPQTIRMISQQTGIPEQILLQANPSIQSADQPIQQGQRIVVPPRQQQPGQPPQTVRQMAQQYNVPVQEFIQANPQFKSADDVVQPQQQINYVSRPQVQYVQQQPGQAPPPPRQQTLAQIAQQNGIPEHVLVQANPSVGGAHAPIQPGTRIVMPPRQQQPGQPPQTVQQFAASNGMQVQEFMQANPQFRSANDTIQPNQQVTYVASAQPQQFVQQQQPQTIRQISQQTGIPEQILLQANPSIQSADQPIQQGQRIIVPPRQEQPGQPPQTVRQMAQQYNVPVQEFIQANPQFKSADDVVQPQQQINMVAQPQMQYVPASPQQQQDFYSNTGYQQQQPQNQTLAQIAQQNNVPEHLLLQANPAIQGAHAPIPTGTRIVMPPRQQYMSAQQLQQQPRQTVQEIAAANNMPVEQFLQANPQFNSGNDIVRPDQQIVFSAQPQQQQPQQYQYQQQQQQPQTLAQIAAANNIPPALLLQQNPQVGGINNPIQPGTQITLPPRQQNQQQQRQTVSQVAAANNMSVPEFIQANPQYSTANDFVDYSQPMRIQASAASAFYGGQQQQQQQQPQPTLAQLAVRHGVSEQAILDANPTLARTGNAQQDATTPIPAGARIVIPPRGASAPNRTVQQTADDCGLPVQELMRMNPTFKDPSQLVPRHQQVVITADPQQQQQYRMQQQQQQQYGGGGMEQQASGTFQYNMQPTSIKTTTLADIARQYGVDEQQLVRLNPQLGSAQASIPPGQQIVIPPRSSGAGAGSSGSYTVADVAMRQGQTVDQFLADNPMYTSSSDVVLPSQNMVIRTEDDGGMFGGQQSSGDFGSPYGNYQQPSLGAYGGQQQKPGYNNATRSGENIATTMADQTQSLSLYANRFGCTPDELMNCNPHLNITSPNDLVEEGSIIVVPNSAKKAQGAARQSESPQLASGVYTARSGESIMLIAQQHGLTVDELRNANPQLQGRSSLNAGETVKLPLQTSNRVATNRQKCFRAMGYNVSRPGETLTSIAHQFGVDVQDIKKLNPEVDLVDVPLPRDQRVLIPNGYRLTVEDDGKVEVIEAIEGDSLRAIAHRTGSSLHEMMKLNPSVRSPGDELTKGRTISIPKRSYPGGVMVYTAPRSVKLSDLCNELALDEDQVVMMNPDLVAGGNTSDTNNIQILRNQRIAIPKPTPGSLAAARQRLKQQTGLRDDMKERFAIRHVAVDGESIASIARRYGVSTDDIVDVNPYLRDVFLGRGTANTILPAGLPIAVIEHQNGKSAMRAARNHNNSSTPVTVPESGYSLEYLESRYGVPEHEIRAANKQYLDGPMRIQPNCTIQMPPPAPVAQAYRGEPFRWSGTAIKNSSPCGLHITEDGECVNSLAALYWVSEDELLYWNPGLKDDPQIGCLPMGTRVVIPLKPETTLCKPAFSTYDVRVTGQKLGAIANAFGVTEAALMGANSRDLTGNRLHKNERIVVPPSSGNNGCVSTCVGHAGQFIEEIAKIYNVPEEDIVLANPGLTGVKVGGCLKNKTRLVIPRPTQKPSNYDSLPIYDVVDVPSGDSDEALAYRLGVEADDLIHHKQQGATRKSTTGTKRVLLNCDSEVAKAGASMKPVRAGDVKWMTMAELRPGESLASFARQAGVDLDELLRLNPHLSGYEKRKAKTTIFLPPPDQRQKVGGVGAGGVISEIGEDGSNSVLAASQHAKNDSRFSAINKEAVAAIKKQYDDSQQMALQLEEAQDQLAELIKSIGNNMRPDDESQMQRLREDLQKMKESHMDVVSNLHEASINKALNDTRIRSWEQSAAKTETGPMKQENARLASELMRTQISAATAEHHARHTLEREFAKRIREAERNMREQIAKANAVSRFRNTGGDDHASNNNNAGALTAAGSTSAAAAAYRNGNKLSQEELEAREQQLADSVRHFIPYKEEQYTKLVEQNRALERAYTAQLSRCTEVEGQLEKVSFAVDTRPSLLKMLHDLLRMSNACAAKADDLSLRFSVQDIPRRTVLGDISDIERRVKDLVRGHRWILGNLFTDVELMHIGSSGSLFKEERGPAELSNDHQPSQSMPRPSATLNNNGNRSMTPSKTMATQSSSMARNEQQQQPQQQQQQRRAGTPTNSTRNSPGVSLRRR